ncbi:MAG TPA: hypothetical protein VFV87_22375 [Pirellulaceae bacterium]|nr:hypothetical protein [Pirellulaceae bacterium]
MWTCVAIVVGVMLAVGGHGCGRHPYKPPPHEDAMKAKIDPSLPLIELPMFDLGQPVTSANDDRSPQALGQTVPASDFSIRVDAKRPASHRGPPLPVVFRILRRGATGELLITASGFLKPTLQEDGTVRYEGTCSRPVAFGASVLEIKLLEQSFLVRSAEVR